MTLPRTIHRRNARKRAKADAIARQRRWDALTPEQQAREKASTDMLNNACRYFASEGLRQVSNDLTFIRTIQRDY